MYKIVKEDTKYNSGLYIAKVTVGGSVWFLKQKPSERILYHGKYRKVLSVYKCYIEELEKGTV